MITFLKSSKVDTHTHALTHTHTCTHTHLHTANNTSLLNLHMRDILKEISHKLNYFIIRGKLHNLLHEIMHMVEYKDTEQIHFSGMYWFSI